MAKNKSYLLVFLVIIFIYLMKPSLLQAIQRPLVLESLQCEGVKSDWLKKVARYSIQDLDYTDLQLSYIDSEGNNLTCIAGWEGLPYLSRKVDDDTMFSYASVTKVFTSELILDLVRRKRINLDDKLVSFLPEIDSKDLKDTRVADISISDLLSHRAGFDSSLTPDTMVSSLPWCPYKIEDLQHISLNFEPNSKNIYSNVGYCMLSQVIESYYSKSYFEVSQNYYNFNSRQIAFIRESPTANTNIPNINYSKYLNSLDFFALSSVGGLSGTSKELSRYVYAMDRYTYPNVTSRPNNIKCHVEDVRSCHGFSGYEYAPDKSLSIYWRDGRLPKTNALVTIDSEGGVLAFLSSSENELSWLSNNDKLVKKVYDILLKK